MIGFIVMVSFFVIVFIAAFFTALAFYKPTKKFLSRVGINAIDQQKRTKPLLPTSSGIMALIGILAGVFLSIGLESFYFHNPLNLTYLLAAAFSIFIITFIGFFDDLNVSRVLTKDKGLEDYRIGLKQWQKPLLVLPAAVPLMAVRAGVTEMSVPFIGIVNFWVFFPLLIVPLAVVFVTNATNMLAGMNGLESGLGFVSTVSIGIYAFFAGRPEAAIIALSAAGALGSILIFNWYPAKILPGDSLTYLIGAAIVTSIIIGNMERFGIFIFTLWVLEFFLKLRSRFKARTLGILKQNGVLETPYKKTYSLIHILMRPKKFTEKQITIILVGIQALICAITLISSLIFLSVL